jgi:uracil-DNA glycosylase
MVQLEKNIPLAATSYLDWWSAAGVDYLVNPEPFNWFCDELGEPEKAKTVATIADDQLVKPQIKKLKVAWSGQLDEIIAQISQGVPLPGNEFGGKSAAPSGNANATLMIVTDMPDSDEVEHRSLGTGNSGKLLRKMVAAIGLQMDDCYLSALACTRPAAGDLPESDIAYLAGFILHQLEIVKPQTILILGSIACQALLGAELMTARGNLHYINHDGQKVLAVTTFHPRTLLARPMLKAQAWKDLQMLIPKGAV